MGERFRIHLFLLLRLPAAFVAGVRLRSTDEAEAVTTIRLRWLNQNPFRSVYFACLSMAAELSTGVLAYREIRRRGGDISMLLTGMEADFTKKATGRICFRCSAGREIIAAISEAALHPGGSVVTVTSLGTDASGQQVAAFRFTWSFRKRTTAAA